MNTAPEPRLLKLRGIRGAYPVPAPSAQERPRIPAAQRAEMTAWMVGGSLAHFHPGISAEACAQILERVLGAAREPKEHGAGAEVQAQHFAFGGKGNVHEIRYDAH